MSLNVGTLVAYLELDDGHFDRGMSGAQGKMRRGVSMLGGLAKMAGLAVAAGLAVGAAAVVKIGLDSIRAASDMQETISKAGVIIGQEALPQVMRFAEGAAKALGQSKQQALDAVATFAIFGKSAGLAGTELAGFSTEMTTLASDLASFNNTSPEQAIEAIGAALRGEAEPIRQYGVLLDDATLKNRALAMGLIQTTTEALTPQQKVLAAHQEILAQTSDAQGDFARTGDGLANMQRTLSAEWANAKVKLGDELLPVALAFTRWAVDEGVPALHGLIDWFKRNKDEIADWGIKTGQVTVSVAEGFLHFAAAGLDALGFIVTAMGETGNYAYTWALRFLGIMDAAMGWVPGWGDNIGQAKAMLGALAFVSDQKTADVARGMHGAADSARGAAADVGTLRGKLGELRSPPPIRVQADTMAAYHQVNQLISYIGRANSSLSVNVRQLDGKRAAGGPVSAYGTYLVGEKGPEILRLGSSSGSVIPNHQLPNSADPFAAPSGDRTVIFNTTINNPKPEPASNVNKVLRRAAALGPFG